MSRELSTLIVLGLAGATAAEGAKPPAPSPFAVAGRGEPALVDVAGLGQLDAATGAARTLFSLDFRGDAADPVGTARAYLAGDAARLGLAGAPTEEALPVRAVSRGKASTVVRFEQRLVGLPVHGGEIAVAVGPKGRISFVSSSYRLGLGAPVNARRRDAAEALDAALAHLGSPLAITLALDARIYAAEDGARHVWRVLLDPQGAPEGEWELLVDAESGAILAAEDKLLYADATGKVFEPDPLSSALALYDCTPPVGICDANDADSALLTAETFDVTLRDVTFADPTYSLIGPYASCLDWDTPAGTCPTNTTGAFSDTRFSDNFEGVNAYHHIDSMLRYLNETLGTPVLPTQYTGGARYDPRGWDGEDQSSYSSSTGRLTFGEGCVDDAEDADVVIHELGHGIHDWLLAGIGVSQVEGLSEGVGDYYAVSYSRSYPNQWSPSDPQYHWVFSWDGHNACWGGRVTNWVIVPSRVYPTHLTASIHNNGQFWSTCSLRAWEVIGRDKMDAAMTEGLRMTGLATNQAGAAQAVLQAAWNLGYSPSELQVIQIKYSSDGCGHNPSMPSDPDVLFFDGFEYQTTSLWDLSCLSGCPEP